jgi:hypothetical protein
LYQFRFGAGWVDGVLDLTQGIFSVNVALGRVKLAVSDIECAILVADGARTGLRDNRRYVGFSGGDRERAEWAVSFATHNKTFYGIDEDCRMARLLTALGGRLIHE